MYYLITSSLCLKFPCVVTEFRWYQTLLTKHLFKDGKTYPESVITTGYKVESPIMEGRPIIGSSCLTRRPVRKSRVLEGQSTS